MSKARPLHLPGARALSLVRQRARAALTAWAREWVDEAMNDGEEQLATLSVESVQAQDLFSAAELEQLSGADGTLWIRRVPRDRQKFGETVMRAELMPLSVYADDWIAAIADEAWAARNRALCDALVGAPQARATTHAAPLALLASVGSGAVTICHEASGLFALVDAGVWKQMSPPDSKGAGLPALVPLDRAALRARLRIEVTLGGVELELPKLMDLQPGDVLRLGARLDESLPVSCEGRPFARAALGDVAGRKSIQITGKHF
jgi:hypothetical protein